MSHCLGLKRSERNQHRRSIGCCLTALLIAGSGSVQGEPPAGSEIKEIATLQVGTAQILSLAFTADGKTMAVGSQGTVKSAEGTLKLWDVVNRKELVSLKGHRGGATSLQFTADGKTLVSSGTFDSAITVWDVAGGKERLSWKTNTRSVESVTLTANEATVISGSRDATIRLWDVATGKERAKLEGHADLINAVVLTRDDRTLASASRDLTVKLWDLAAGKERATLKGHTGWVLELALSPDEATLASASLDMTVRLWDLAPGKERAILKGPHPFHAVAFAPDGKILVTGSGLKSKPGGNAVTCGEVMFWDVATGQVRATLKIDTGPVKALAFTADGKILATGNVDGTVKLWNVASLSRAK